MKRCLILISALLLGCATVSAKKFTNIVGGGWRLPTKFSISSNSNVFGDIDYGVQTGFSADYMGYFDNGIGFRAFFDAGFTEASLKNDEKKQNSAMADVAIGAGYVPLRTDKFALGFFGIIGADAEIISYEKNSKKYHYDYTAAFCGINSTFVFTPKNMFSFYGSVTGCSLLPASIENYEKVDNKKKNKISYSTEACFKIIPTVGICWKF